MTRQHKLWRCQRCPPVSCQVQCPSCMCWMLLFKSNKHITAHCYRTTCLLADCALVFQLIVSNWLRDSAKRFNLWTELTPDAAFQSYMYHVISYYHEGLSFDASQQSTSFGSPQSWMNGISRCFGCRCVVATLRHLQHSAVLLLRVNAFEKCS